MSLKEMEKEGSFAAGTSRKQEQHIFGGDISHGTSSSQSVFQPIPSYQPSYRRPSSSSSEEIGTEPRIEGYMRELPTSLNPSTDHIPLGLVIELTAFLVETSANNVNQPV